MAVVVGGGGGGDMFWWVELGELSKLPRAGRGRARLQANDQLVRAWYN